MIDTHCHLEQSVYDNDRGDIIANCRRKLKAVITCDPNPNTYDTTFSMVKASSGFVFAVAGIHPEYVGKYDESEIDKVMETLRRNRDMLVGVGEAGLDYHYVKEESERRMQQEMFVKFIKLAMKLKLPVTVHIRNGDDREDHDAFEDAVDILESEGAKRVHLHMFGSRELLSRVMDNGWYISENAIIIRSKGYKKIVRDVPLDRLMLETDAPWLHPSGDVEKRNDPTGVIEVAKKVAEIKKVKFEEVVEKTTRNAVEFFGLDL